VGLSGQITTKCDTLEWMELKTCGIRKAYVFVAGLGFSHAWQQRSVALTCRCRRRNCNSGCSDASVAVVARQAIHLSHS
jgi:hypothetical protein